MRCPGQDTRYWKPGDIFEVPCPVCGKPVEFFRDEGARRCPSCGFKFKNPKIDLACAEWCPQAEQCLAGIPGVEGGRLDQTLLSKQLIEAMKRVFGQDQKRIAHTLMVYEYAKEIFQCEGGNPKVVFGAALLHDIGIQEAERKYHSSAGKYQEIEGPPIARKILEELKLEPEIIEHICKIIANHHTAKDIDTLEFRILWDADWLVNLPEEYPGASPEALKTLIDKVFRTKTGQAKAKELFLKEG